MSKAMALSVLILAIFPATVFADAAFPESETVWLFYETFEGDFPPAGWTLVQTNPEQTWHQADCAEYAGRKCAVVSGSTGASSDEWIITGPVFLNGPGSPNDIYDGSIGLDFQPDVSEYLKTLFFIDEYPETHSALANWSPEKLQFQELNEESWTNVYNALGGSSPIYFALKYAGDNPPSVEVGIFSAQVTYDYESYGNNNQDDQGGSDDGDDAGDDDDDDNGACGCSISEAGGPSALAFLMTFIGIAAFWISARRNLR